MMKLSQTHTWMNMLVDKGTLIDSRAIIIVYICDPLRTYLVHTSVLMRKWMWNGKKRVKTHNRK